VLSDVVQRQAARRAAPVKFMQQKTLLALVQSFFTVAEPQQGMSPLTILSYRDPRLVTRALEVALRAVFGFQRRQARRPAREPRTGAVTFVQRFGGALNLNVHGYRSPRQIPCFSRWLAEVAGSIPACSTNPLRARRLKVAAGMLREMILFPAA
jgi:hypothetical protein